MKSYAYIYIAIAIFILTLFGCLYGNGGIEPSILISGSAQKGPFVIGSTVIVSVLSSDSNPTGITYSTTTMNDVGEFSISVDAVEFLDIAVTGYHFSETTGLLSDSTLTLRSLYHVTTDVNQISYVNVLTHLARSRVLELINVHGLAFQTALSQAEDEIVASLSFVFPASEIAGFSNCHIYVESSSEPSGNDYLLSLSSCLNLYASSRAALNNTSVDAELTFLLSNISQDLKTDGVIDDTQLLNNLYTKSLELNQDDIEANLISIREAANLPRTDIPNVIYFQDVDKDGIGNFWDTDDDNDGTLDIYDAFPFDPEEVVDTDGDGIGDNSDLDDDGDGILDIDDADPNTPEIYTVELPATGSLNDNGYVGADDSSIGVSAPMPRFLIDIGIVLDQMTGLSWAKNAGLFVGNYADTIKYIENMNEGVIENYGRTDWRLPTWKEFLSLLDRGQFSPALPSGHPFIGVDVDTYYWTSTDRANAISLLYGCSDSNDRYSESNMYSIWPVAGGSSIVSPTYRIISSLTGERGVQWGSARFMDNDDGTVTDALTKLMWSKKMNEAETLLNWYDALDYVAIMNSGDVENYGYSDWRVPTIVEIESLIFHGSDDAVSLPLGHPFTLAESAQGSGHIEIWSSTAYPFDGAAYCIDLSFGLHSGGNMMSNPKGVWVVRKIIL